MPLTSLYDIRNEALIFKEWKFKSHSDENYAKGILITGANSFIACHLIKLLQNDWKGEIHLLLRSPNQTEAVNKMKLAFTSWKLGIFNPAAFIIHAGDLLGEQLGLSHEAFDQIKKNTGNVLHFAMTPLYHIPYKHFKQQWLPELEKMIHFCGDDVHPKRLHYPSSFNANFFTCDEDFEHLNSNAWQSGYAGFKWVANKVLQNAFQQHLKGCIYDIPLVVGSRSKGICPENYSIWHILGLFRETGLFIDFEFKIIPVDVLAQVMVSNMQAFQNGEGQQFLRPVLKDPVNQRVINKSMALLLGLKHSTRDDLIQACPHKRKCNFMIPENFHALLEKVNSLEAVYTDSLHEHSLPSAKKVFQKNVQQFLRKHLSNSIKEKFAKSFQTTR